MIIDLPPDFDSQWLAQFLAARAVPGLETLNGGTYRRSLWIEGLPVVLSISFTDQSALEATWSGDSSADAVSETVRRMFSLGTDLSEFKQMASHDAVLSPLVARQPGICVPVYADPFEGTIRAILGQQISVAATKTIAARLVDRFGDVSPEPSLGLKMFPGPEAIAAASIENIRAIGLTSAKAATLIFVSRAVASGSLDFKELQGLAGDEIESRLIKLPGIGQWTAQYLRMRVFGDLDSLPSGDLVVRKAIQRLQPGDALISARDMAILAERWRPWRSYAALHLWNSMSNPEPA